MNRFTLPFAAALIVCGGAVFCFSHDIVLAAPPTAALVVPAAPVAPSPTPFVDEAAGRRLLFAARDYYQAAALNGTAFSVRATLASTNGMPTPPMLTASVTETVLGYTPARRLFISTETTTPGGNHRIVRKAISDGETLLATRFEQNGTAPPVREMVRVPLDETTILPRVVGAAGFAPFSVGATLAANPQTPLSPQSRIAWLSGTQKLPSGTLVDVVSENDAPTGKNENETRRSRRSFLDKQTHRLVRFEEWVTRQTKPRSARKNQPADDGLRVSYKREDYVYVSGDAARSKAAYPQTLPPGYEEKTPPTLPPAPAPTQQTADPKALALVAKWQNGWERFLSYSAQVELSFEATTRTENSRPLPDAWKKSGVRYREVVLRRPDNRARIVQEPLAADNTWNGSRTLLVVSDGKQVRGVVEGGAGVGRRRRNNGNADAVAAGGPLPQTRTVPLDDPRQLWGRINQVGYNERFGVLGGLSYVFLVPLPFQIMDKIAYEGASVLDNGEPVEIITLTKTDVNTNGQSGQQTETVTTWRIALGAADGLPRLVEARRISTTTGRFERDQPPTLMVTTRFRSVRVDGEPSQAAFVLPPYLP